MNSLSMHIVNFKNITVQRLMWSPPLSLPFWNKLTTGGQRIVLKINRREGASLQHSSKGSPPPTPTGLPTGRDGLLVLLSEARRVVWGSSSPPQLPVYPQE